jgi:hypothetical protein
MTEQTPPKLTGRDNFFNFCNTGAMAITWLVAAQWIVATWITQYNYAKRRGRQFRLQWPHTLSVFAVAGRPQMIIENLRSFGISAQGLGSQIIIMDNIKGCLLSFIVAESQWEYADALLEQLAQGEYVVTSTPGTKRGAVFTRRWGVTAKARSFDEGLNGMIGNMFKDELKAPKAAKLGKTWR